MEKFRDYTIALLKRNALIVDDPEELKNEKAAAETLNLYQKNGYALSDQVVDFLTYFSNKKIGFKAKAGKDEIHFKTKRVLKSGIRMWEETYQMKGIVPLGLVYTEHMVFFCDEKGWTYAAFDYFVVLFGYTPFEGLNNLLSNTILKKIDFDTRDRSIDTKKLVNVSLKRSTPAGRLIPAYDADLEEFEIAGDGSDGGGITFSVGGSISFFLTTDYRVESISYSMGLRHHQVVSVFPEHSIDREQFYDVKIDEKCVYENISFEYETIRCLADKSFKNFMILFKPQDKYLGKQLSKQTAVFITGNNEFVGFKISI